MWVSEMFVPPAEGSASSFYRPRRGELHVQDVYGVISSPPDPGENSWSFLSPSAAEHGVGRGRRPCKSFDCARGVSVSCGASRWRGGDVSEECIVPCVRWDRASRVLKTLVFPRSRAVLWSRVVAHARRGSCRGEKYQG